MRLSNKALTVVILVAVFVSFSLVFVSAYYIYQGQDYFKVVKVEQKQFLGFDGRICDESGKLIGIYHPLPKTLREATIGDKLIYGDCK